MELCGNLYCLIGASVIIFDFSLLLVLVALILPCSQSGIGGSIVYMIL